MIKPFQTSVAQSWILESLSFHKLCFSHSLHSEILTSEALGWLLYQNDRQQVLADFVHLSLHLQLSVWSLLHSWVIAHSALRLFLLPLPCDVSSTPQPNFYAFKTRISWSHFAVQNLPTASYFTDREGLRPYYDLLGFVCPHPISSLSTRFCPFAYALLPTLVSDLILNTPLQNRWLFSLNWIAAIGAAFGPIC